MVALNTAYAPRNTSTRSQNRVGDFFCKVGQGVGVKTSVRLKVFALVGVLVEYRFFNKKEPDWFFSLQPQRENYEKNTINLKRGVRTQESGVRIDSEQLAELTHPPKWRDGFYL